MTGSPRVLDRPPPNRPPGRQPGRFERLAELRRDQCLCEPVRGREGHVNRRGERLSAAADAAATLRWKKAYITRYARRRLGLNVIMEWAPDAGCLYIWPGEPVAPVRRR